MSSKQSTWTYTGTFINACSTILTVDFIIDHRFCYTSSYNTYISRRYMSRYALESPYLRLTFWHQALVTESRRTWQPSLTSLGIRGLHSRRPQRQIECSKWRCRLRDVKHVTASCHNDVMIPYKSSHPVGNAMTFQLFIGYRLPTVPSAVFVQPCALPEPFQRFSLFPWIKAVLVV